VSPRASLRRRRGFSLLEMIMVLLIVALVMALVGPMIEGGFTQREVRRAARQIAATMHHCRGEALARGTPQGLVLDAPENSIRTSDEGRWAILTDRAIITDLQGGEMVGDGVMQVLFYPNGSTSGADIVVASRRDPSEIRLRVQLDPLIGRVEVKDESPE